MYPLRERGSGLKFPLSQMCVYVTTPGEGLWPFNVYDHLITDVNHPVWRVVDVSGAQRYWVAVRLH